MENVIGSACVRFYRSFPRNDSEIRQNLAAGELQVASADLIEV